MFLTGLTEAALRELAGQCDPADLPAQLARKIVHVEAVRVEVKRVEAERVREDARHRDAVAANAAELREWQGQCPHPAPTRHKGGEPESYQFDYTQCPVCGWRSEE